MAERCDLLLQGEGAGVIRTRVFDPSHRHPGLDRAPGRYQRRREDAVHRRTYGHGTAIEDRLAAAAHNNVLIGCQSTDGDKR
jgi:hypothetical protein